jgi:energy-coupling factor transporter transmembrane protein EcfT
MAEQKQKKKKRGLVKRLLKYIGLSILVLLILLALFAEAPKKIVILLLIILATFTALPKPARKWFWLSVSALIFAFVTWTLLPEDDEGWRPFTFDEELSALEAKYSIPDEENAVLIYDEILETLDIDSNQPEFYLKTKPSSKDEPWHSKDHPETAEWLKNHQSTIDNLIQAGKKDRCIFLPIGSDIITFSKLIEKVPKFRQCIFLLLSAANNDVAEGRTDAAIEKYLSILNIANHLYQQPTLVYYQMGVLERLGLQLLNRHIIESQPTEAQLKLISNSIKNLQDNWGSDLRNILDLENLYAKNMLSGMYYEINPHGKIRFSRGSLALTNGQIRNGTYTRRKCAKLGTILGWLYLPSSPEKIGKYVDAGYEKHYAMTRPDFDWNTQPDQQQLKFKLNYGYMVELLTSLTYPVYFPIHEKYQRDLTYRRGSRLLIAIKQYHNENNTWPPDLDSIKSAAPTEAFIDPVTSNPLQYENHGERFSLYGETANIWPK